MSSYVAPLVNAGIGSALVYVPAYQLGYSAFQTSIIGFVGRIILGFIPGFTSFIGQTPPSKIVSVLENLLLLVPGGLMYFKFGVSGVVIYILVALIPALLLLSLAGVIAVAGSAQKKH